jgi:predicted chitinase
VTVFEEGPPPPLPRGAAPAEPDGAEQRLRGLDGPKQRLQQEQPAGTAATSMALGGAGVDRGPTAGKFEPDAHERLTRGVDAVHPDEIDGPGDLPAEAEARVALPQVSWPSSDSESPCYAHLAAAAAGSQNGNAPFSFTGADLRLLCAANAFKPEGYGDRIVFALRGAMLRRDDSCKDVDEIALVETRPDHRNFRCVIGVFDTRTAKLSAFKASTVPNAAYMTNYYKKVHAIRPYGETGANLLPTGCYVFRVGVHRNSIYPALRLTDPERLAEDGKALVLRTSDDLTYRLDDFWDPCVPYDHVHCAYSYEAFSSAGCLTICGPNQAGPWGQFQDILKTVPRGNRLDVVLLTGREACLAAQLREEHRGADAESVRAALVRLRPGSQGERVRKLQTLLGLEASGYFGWRTKQALIERQRQSGLGGDGIYAPALDQRIGWDVFDFASGPTSVVAARSAASAHAGAARIQPAPAEVGQFAPRALQEYLRVLVEEGPAELQRCGINANPLRFCHFMAQIAHESAGFSISCESLNYKTVDRLRAVWPNRFADDASARPYLLNEQMLAERVYGGRLGNTRKGDAFRYRGRGFVQTTGRDAYREMGNKLQLPLEDNPDLLLDPLVALRAACRTWADNAHPGERTMNTLADCNKLEALTYRINGGYTNLEGRRTEFVKAWRIWGKGDPPAGQVEPEVIERGDRGDLVSKLTRSLGELGYYQGGADHIFGTKVYAAVRKFQARQGLPPSGVVDKETWDAIERALSSRAASRGRQAVGGAPRGDAAVRLRLKLRAALAVALLAVGCIGIFLVARITGAELPTPLLWLPWMFAACVLSALLGVWAATRYLRQPPPHDLPDAAVLADGGAEQREPVRSGTPLAGE